MGKKTKNARQKNKQQKILFTGLCFHSNASRISQHNFKFFQKRQQINFITKQSTKNFKMTQKVRIGLKTKRKINEFSQIRIINQLIKICQTTFCRMQGNIQAFQATFQHQVPCKKEFEYQISQREEEMNLISQYLDFKTPVMEQIGKVTPKYDQSTSNSSSEQVQSHSNDIGSSNQAQPRRKPSQFHNFQKHLITTIKAIIKLKSVPHHQKSFISLAHEILEYLYKSKKTTKRFLYRLLGKNIYDQKSSPQQIKFSNEYSQILQYFDEYSLSQIQSAQEFLCREVIRQSRKALQCDSFKIGRMRKTQEFKSYFSKFIEELENGQASKRLPKSVKISLLKKEEAGTGSP